MHNEMIEEKNYPAMSHYLVFLAGQIISLIGSQVVSFAIIWFVVIETHSPQILALLMFMTWIIISSVSPFAGVYVDRWNRKLIIIISDLMLALITLVLILIVDSDTGVNEILILIVIMGIRAIFRVFQSPAVEAIIPLMVEETKRSRVNSFRYFSTIFSAIIGPVIGAFLFEFMSFTQILWIDVITFIIAVIPTIFIKIPSIKSKTSSKDSFNIETSKSSFLTEFRAGLSIIKSKGLLSLIIIFPITNFFETPLNLLLPLLLESVYNSTALEFAFVIVAFQGTVSIVSLLLSWKSFLDNRDPAKVIILGLLIIFIGKIILIFPPAGALNFMILFLIIGMIIQGIASPMINIYVNTLTQKMIPVEAQGRVNAVSMSISSITVPFGILLTGFLAEILGIRVFLFISAVLGIFSVIMIWSLTSFSQVGKKFISNPHESSKHPSQTDKIQNAIPGT